MERDKLKHTNWKVFEPYVIASLCGIIEFIEIPKLVIDTHYAVYSPSGFIPGLNDESIHYLGWTLGTRNYNRCYCVLVDAPVEDIYKRILQDEERRRGEISLDYLNEERKWNREFQERYVHILSKYVDTRKHIIENTTLESSLKEFQKLTSE